MGRQRKLRTKRQQRIDHDVAAYIAATERSIAPEREDRAPSIPVVNGGHRTGKRRRGNSLTKQAPITTTRVTALYQVFDDSGVCIAADQREVRYRRDS